MDYKVRKTADTYHFYTIAKFKTFQEAFDFCDYYNWEIVDENGFAWELSIE